MEKKFNLFGILGIVILVAVSTMGSVKYQRAPRVLSGQAASPLACLPASSGSEFRSPHVWNGFLIPPVDVTNSLDDPVLACFPEGALTASQPYQGIPVTGALPVFPQYQYRSANAAASASSVFPQYQYRSASAAASRVFPQYQYRSANAAASASSVFPQYQYRSASAAASRVFPQYQYRAANTAVSASGVFPQYQYRSASAAASRVFPQYQYRSAFTAPSPVFRQYQYRSFGSEPGLAPHKMLFSGH